MSTTGQCSDPRVGDSGGSDRIDQADLAGTGPGPVTTSSALLLRPPWAVPAVVFAVAVAMRLVPLLVQHTLTGVLEYDDGVQFSAAAQLVAGHLPYRDFVFIQPPGVVLLLSPFTALAHWTGGTVAMAAARVVFVAVAGANAALIAYLLRARGRAAALAGGLLYAMWQDTVRRQLLASSAIVADAATVEQGWGVATVALFHRLYVPVGQADGYTLYRRR
jgi:hypothetical protein